MKIPSPKEIGTWPLSQSVTHTARVDTVLDRFLTAVATGDFHYTSTSESRVVMYPVNADYCKDVVWNDAVKALKEAGWNVRHSMMSCGHGTFNAIVLE